MALAASFKYYSINVKIEELQHQYVDHLTPSAWTRPPAPINPLWPIFNN